MATSDTPFYYLNPDGTDMYDTFVSKYGYDAVFAHMAMQIEEYAKRAVYKGQLQQDLHKISVIKKRMIALLKEEYKSSLSDIAAQLELPFNNTTL